MNIDPKLIQQALSALPYPLGKANLIQLVRQAGVNDQIITMLELLPDKTFNSAEEVQQALGGLGNLGNLGGFFK